MSEKIKVGILGKGTQMVNVEAAQTIGELRDLLALDSNIQATDGDGKVLTDKTPITDAKNKTVNFTPNVEGGC